MPFRWRATHERHDGRLLDAVELALWSRSGVIAERRLQAGAVVPVGHAFDLTVVPADRLRGSPDRLPAVEVLERQDPPPHPRRELLLLQTFQLVTIGSRQL